MDDATKKTLDLIEGASERLNIAEKGRQLIVVVRDYVDDGDLENAARVLGDIDDLYFEEYMYEQCANDELLADAVATLIEVLGMGFWILVRPRQYLS